MILSPARNVSRAPRARLAASAGRQFIFLVCASLAFSAGAAEPTFDFTPKSTEATLGDRIEAVLRANDPAFDAARIIRVEIEADPAVWHVAQPWQRPMAGDERSSAHEGAAILQPFETGELELPKALVFYRAADGSEASAEAGRGQVNVKSVLPPEDGAAAPAGAATGASAASALPPKKRDQIYSYRPLYEFPRDWRRLALIGGLFALSAVILGWLLARWLRRRAARAAELPAEPELPPGLWALAQIDRLSRAGPGREGPAKAIATLSSEVVRAYLSRRFGIPALDMTTFECLRALEPSGVPEDSLRTIRKYLENCDIVKFSKFEPPPERWPVFWSGARAIVHLTSPEEELSGAAAPAAPAEAARA